MKEKRVSNPRQYVRSVCLVLSVESIMRRSGGKLV